MKLIRHKLREVGDVVNAQRHVLIVSTHIKHFLGLF